MIQLKTPRIFDGSDQVGFWQEVLCWTPLDSVGLAFWAQHCNLESLSVSTFVATSLTQLQKLEWSSVICVDLDSQQWGRSTRLDSTSQSSLLASDTLLNGSLWPENGYENIKSIWKYCDSCMAQKNPTSNLQMAPLCFPVPFDSWVSNLSSSSMRLFKASVSSNSSSALEAKSLPQIRWPCLCVYWRGAWLRLRASAAENCLLTDFCFD